jgi:hypothetical protein
MKTLLAVLALAILSACGVETATTAATVAEMKRREMEAAKRNLQEAKQKIEQNTQVIMERAAQSDAQSDDKAKD